MEKDFIEIIDDIHRHYEKFLSEERERQNAKIEKESQKRQEIFKVLFDEKVDFSVIQKIQNILFQ